MILSLFGRGGGRHFSCLAQILHFAGGGGASSQIWYLPPPSSHSFFPLKVSIFNLYLRFMSRQLCLASGYKSGIYHFIINVIKSYVQMCGEFSRLHTVFWGEKWACSIDTRNLQSQLIQHCIRKVQPTKMYIIS